MAKDCQSVFVYVPLCSISLLFILFSLVFHEYIFPSFINSRDLFNKFPCFSVTVSALVFLLEWTFVLRGGQYYIVLRNEICTGVKAAKGGITWLKVR